jgi:shikimate kinase
MILVLIGYMGSGKSSIGKKLSKKLDWDLVDLDDYIVAKEACSIKEIFDNKGEKYFRDKEKYYLHELLNTKKNSILSLGGGTPCFENNMDHILASEDTKSFYLKSSLNKLTDKLILKKEKRPLIANIETKEALRNFIKGHLSDRTPYYEKATYHVTTDNKKKKEVVTEIYKVLKSN